MAEGLAHLPDMQFLPPMPFNVAEQQRILERARPLVRTVRDSRLKTGGLDAFLLNARSTDLGPAERKLKKQVEKLTERKAATAA